MDLDKLPLYYQIVEDFKIKLITKKLKTNEKVPPIKDLVHHYDVNPNTVQRAFLELERQGILSPTRTGRVVSISSEKLAELEYEYAQQLFDNFAQKIDELELDEEKIEALLKESFKKIAEKKHSKF